MVPTDRVWNGTYKTCSRMDPLKCAQGWDTTNVPRNGTQQMCPGMGHNKCAQEWDTTNVPRDGTQQMCPGMGHNKCAQEWDTTNVPRNYTHVHVQTAGVLTDVRWRSKRAFSVTGSFKVLSITASASRSWT